MRLHERDRQLSDLKALFEDACSGQQQTVLVSGAVGVGKTEIIRRFAEVAVGAGATHCTATVTAASRGLPFGALLQMFSSPGLPETTRRQVVQFLDTEVGSAWVCATSSGDIFSSKNLTYVPHILSGFLQDVIDETGRPLLLTLDDAHHADPHSLSCLQSVIGRLSHSPLMVVIGAADGPQSFAPAFLSGLSGTPYSRDVRLEPLTERGVETMLDEQRVGVAARRAAVECHAMTGGNPAMVRGFIHDARRSGQDADRPRTETGRACQAILHRCDPAMLSLARWTAVLGETEALSIAGRLAGLDGESTARTLRALNRTGCFSGDRFRHSVLRHAVLDGIAPTERTAMYEEAAALLWIEGTAAPVVAEQLVAAGRTQAEWAIPVLNDAAHQALGRGRVRCALTYLRLACRAPVQGFLHDTSRALLMRAEWRANPALTMRREAEVVAALRSGRDPGVPDLSAWAGRLLWFGRENDARAALTRLGDHRDALDRSQTDHLEGLRLGLFCLFPARDEPDRAVMARLDGRAEVATTDLMSHALQLLVRTMMGGPAEVMTAAEHLLEQSPLNEHTFGALACALGALVHGGALGTADRWCASLQEDVVAEESPTWLAVLGVLRSMIVLRRGDLVAAETQAARALELVPGEGWGVGILLALSVLIEVTTATGRYEEAITHLRAPVPVVLSRTTLAIPYLRARSRLHAARGSFDRALSDITLMSDLMAKWNLDLPALAPWRTDAAFVHLQLGRREEARRLAAVQWEMLTSAQARERGITLRALAAAGDPSKRFARLTQSVRELHESGDRLELSLALADLDRLQRGSGEERGVPETDPRSERIPRQRGAVAVDAEHPACVDQVDAAETRNSAAAWEGNQQLSKAEKRVAALAADGYSNRQIASKLFITISTVEQHLTKVYRKLDVSRRRDLVDDTTSGTQVG